MAIKLMIPGILLCVAFSFFRKKKLGTKRFKFSKPTKKIKIPKPILRILFVLAVFYIPIMLIRINYVTSNQSARDTNDRICEVYEETILQDATSFDSYMLNPFITGPYCLLEFFLGILALTFLGLWLIFIALLVLLGWILYGEEDKYIFFHKIPPFRD